MSFVQFQNKNNELTSVPFLWVLCWLPCLLPSRVFSPKTQTACRKMMLWFMKTPEKTFWLFVCVRSVRFKLLSTKVQRKSSSNFVIFSQFKILNWMSGAWIHFLPFSVNTLTVYTRSYHTVFSVSPFVSFRLGRGC